MSPPGWDIWTLQFYSVFAQLCKLCWAPLGSGVNGPFQNQPQIDGIHISAVSLRDLTKLCRPSDFKKYVCWLLKNLICLEGRIHSFIFLWGLLVKNVDHDFMITSIKRRNHETCESFAVIVTSFRQNNTLPSQPSLLWATAVASPLMTSRKKSAGLLWVSQVYPVKWKLLSDTSCADCGGVIKMPSSYQCLRSNPKRWVLDRDKPKHLKTKNDNVTFLGKYLLRWWKTARLIPKSEKSTLNNSIMTFCQFEICNVRG